MADLNSLVTIKPETISALNETLKIAIGAFGSIAVGVGTWITIISNKTSKAAKVNEGVTVVNTEALTAHTAEMTKLKTDIIQIKDSASKEMTDFAGLIREVRHELASEVEKVKIGIMKIHDVHSRELSRIPKIEDAITALQNNWKVHDETLRPLVQGIKKKFGDNK